MYAMFLLSIFDGLDVDQLGEAIGLTIVIVLSPMALHCFLYVSYAIGQTIYNTEASNLTLIGICDLEVLNDGFLPFVSLQIVV